MVLIFTLCIFTSIGSLVSWEYSRNIESDLLESWGIQRILARDKIKLKFEEKEVKKITPSGEKNLTCSDVHKTLKTPFVAVILFRTSGRLLCMGSIVDRLHILTAKVCYEKVDPPDLRVLTGCFKAYWARDSQISIVRKILRHEYAVAMLRLKSPITYTKYIQASKLPPSSTADQEKFEKVFPPPYQIVGFSVDRYDVPGDYVSKEKYYKVLGDTFVPHAKCKSNYTKTLLLNPQKLFCTIGNATFCWGSLGGPVLKWNPKDAYFMQIGMVIADYCTTSETGPLLSARIDAFAEWIQGNAYQGHHAL